MSNFKKSSQKDSFDSIKTHFNKKNWREQKYSNKAKIQRWETVKRKQAERQYYKECKKLDFNFKSKHEDTYKSGLHKTLKEALSQYKAQKEQSMERKLEQESIKKERIKAIKAYKEKKAERFKKLSQKTKKGQPLMKGRIELLLEKIQKQYVNNEIQKNLK